MTLRSIPLVLVVLSFVVAFPTSAVAEPVRVVLLTPATQTAAPGQLLAVPFSIRVERANGEPLPGVQINYAVNQFGCLSSSLPPCPPGDGEYGGFDTSAPPPLHVTVTTGADGTVTAPPFRAGMPVPGRLPFEFTVLPFAFAQTTPNGFEITLSESLRPIGGLGAANTTVVIAAPQTEEIPAIGPAGLLMLALVLAGWAVLATARAPS